MTSELDGAKAELAAAQARLARERRDVVAPLQRMKDQNHVTEMARHLLRRGGRRGPVPGAH